MTLDGDAAGRLEAAVGRIGEATLGRPRTGLGHDDADDDLGTIATDSAIGFDPMPLLRAFDEAGARVVVIGQVAGILHGSAELTGDLDLLWDGDPRAAGAVAAAFSAVSARLFDGDGAALACSPAAFALPKVQFSAATVSGDCCTPALAWGALPVRDFLARACLTRTRTGVDIHYLERRDLIAMRRAAGRVKDLRRAEELERSP